MANQSVGKRGSLPVNPLTSQGLGQRGIQAYMLQALGLLLLKAFYLHRYLTVSGYGIVLAAQFADVLSELNHRKCGLITKGQ
jgi:hypothetical protein